MLGDHLMASDAAPHRSRDDDNHQDTQADRPLISAIRNIATNGPPQLTFKFFHHICRLTAVACVLNR